MLSGQAPGPPTRKEIQCSGLSGPVQSMARGVTGKISTKVKPIKHGESEGGYQGTGCG